VARGQAKRASRRCAQHGQRGDGPHESARPTPPSQPIAKTLGLFKTRECVLDHCAVQRIVATSRRGGYRKYARGLQLHRTVRARRQVTIQDGLILLV
jgi:hypothetical protein